MIKKILFILLIILALLGTSAIIILRQIELNASKEMPKIESTRKELSFHDIPLEEVKLKRMFSNKDSVTYSDALIMLDSCLEKNIYVNHMLSCCSQPKTWEISDPQKLVGLNTGVQK